MQFAQWRGSPKWYDFVPMATRIGCVAHKTIKQWRERMLFLGADCNVYAIDLRGSIVAVGDAIQPYMERIVNYERLNRSVAWVDLIDNYYWLVVPTEAHGGEYGRHIFCLNLTTGAWTEGEFADPGLEVLDAFQARVFDEFVFYLLGAADGRIYEYDHFNLMADRDTQWESYVWSKVYDFMEYFRQVAETGSIHKLALHGDSGLAIGRARTGRTLSMVAADTSIQTFGQINQDLAQVRADLARTRGYVSGRTIDQRFGQWGIQWPAGTQTPMSVDGITAWSNPGGETR